MLKNCKTCKKPFKVTPSKYKTKVYCSKACMAEDYRVRLQGSANPCYRPKGQIVQGKLPWGQANHYRSLKLKKLQCLGCKRPFATRHGRQKYCDQCGYITVACVVCENPFAHHRSMIKTTCSEACARKQRAIRQRGEKSHRWQGGKTDEALIFRCSLDYALWRNEVFKRDNYTCQLCFKRGNKVCAHHIKRFAMHRELALVVENGITLCWDCHASIRCKEGQYEEQFYAITTIQGKELSA